MLLGRSEWNLTPYVAGEDEDGNDLGICRAYKLDQLVPGKLKINISGDGKSTCFIPYHMEEHKVTEQFEALGLPEPENFEWLQLEQPLLPSNAIQAGRTQQGDKLFMGKCPVAHGGKAFTAFGKIHYVPMMHYGSHGKEFECSPYETFVCKRVDLQGSRFAPPTIMIDPDNYIFYYPANFSMAYMIQRRRNDYCLLQQDRQPQVGACKEQRRLYFAEVHADLGFPYYVIIHDGEHAFGISPLRYRVANKIGAENIQSVAANRRFHWYISRKGKYFQLINREMAMALDSNDESTVYALAENGGSFQDWRIRPWKYWSSSSRFLLRSTSWFYIL